ncbi:acireductone synthase [Ahniella affigens]|uniref:Enolase-phosphatase E1 n=1 Tax=Ahniella affigens TaxID=2021234 RepID=A0A2P1PTL1_9GAMM|nr:acireductone synthase [Ahniella affigens]AVP98173.1 acireductone synthase [Ahniella affigens]
MSRIILTDIEGTTSAIDFVHRVLFPYSRAALPDFVRTHANNPAVQSEIAAVRAELGGNANLEQVIATLLEWIDADRKATPLKALQGLIWDVGYQTGAFTAHVYIDAYDQLRSWHQAGMPLYVYSSGSIAAQKLFFRYSVFGNLLPWFSGHFDTTSGGKREAESYRRIAAALQQPAEAILFLSDVEAELDAARGAGMKTAQICRADAPPISTGGHPVHATFRTILPG